MILITYFDNVMTWNKSLSHHLNLLQLTNIWEDNKLLWESNEQLKALKLMSKCVFWIKLVIPYKYVYFTFIRRGGHRRTNSFHTTKNCIGSFWSKELHLGSDLQKNCIQSLIYCSGPGHRIGTLLYPCVGQNAPKSMRIKGTCQGVICTCQNFLVH